jgi:putative hydrolase of the HAD superfamily
MRAVLFDFGGTLDSPRHWLDRFLTHYNDAGLAVTRAELDPAFDTATRIAYRSSDALGNHSLQELIPFLVNLQLEHLCDECTDVSRMVKQLAAGSFKREITHRISEAFIEESMDGLARSRTVLSSLKSRFAIGVVSNFYGNLERILRDAGFAPIVGALADSGRLGIYKPDVRIYRAALAMLAVSAAETIMVGDSLERDCAPARGLGMRTVWLRHLEAPREPAGRIHADFTIDGLEELDELICRMS